MQSETGFPSSHKLKSYVASKSRLKLAARAVLSADAGLLVLLALAREGEIAPIKTKFDVAPHRLQNGLRSALQCLSDVSRV